MSRIINQRLTDTIAFLAAARSYWLRVFPEACLERRDLRHRALRIPDPALRRLALHAQATKWASLEGAAAFAAFSPPAQRSAVARLLIRYQAVYDYADTLMEQPNPTPVANARQLHSALLAVLEPDRRHPDYYRHHSRDDDGGYLARLIDDCSAVLAELPAYAELAAAIIASAHRIIDYQCGINLAAEHDRPLLMRSALEKAPSRSLCWWEVWAACGSSLDTLALLAAAADPRTDASHAAAVEALYWPWGCALHTFLDCLIDRAEDTATGQPNLLDLYPSSEHAARRMGFITRQALRHATLAGPSHRLILAGMVSLYLSDDQAWTPAARPITDSVLAALGEDAKPAMLTLRARRLTHHDRPRRSTRTIAISATDHPVSDTSCR